MVKKLKQDGDEEKKWELIPQHILETRICTLLPLQSVFSLSGVSKQWYKLVHTWAVLRPFLLRRRSNQLFNYCLLKKVLPLPQGVETLEDENGSRACAVSVVNFPLHLAVAKQSAHRSVWNIKIFKLLTDDVSPCWENVLQVKGSSKHGQSREIGSVKFEISSNDSSNGRQFHLLFLGQESKCVHFY